VRRKFAKAWIFIDRETEADDNAEHLYRWVKKHHPEVNAWSCWIVLRRTGIAGRRRIPADVTKLDAKTSDFEQ
jgi:inhibitor of KinA sporulation pathway (predicted exonuclease)